MKKVNHDRLTFAFLDHMSAGSEVLTDLHLGCGGGLWLETVTGFHALVGQQGLGGIVLKVQPFAGLDVQLLRYII